ncbi:MAG: hypothetical protein ABI811_22940, partial [Acidobacteriota bacterium]
RRSRQVGFAGRVSERGCCSAAAAAVGRCRGASLGAPSLSRVAPPGQGESDARSASRVAPPGQGESDAHADARRQPAAAVARAAPRLAAGRLPLRKFGRSFVVTPRRSSLTRPAKPT